MTRRAITRADGVTVREKVARALGRPCSLAWGRDELLAIDGWIGTEKATGAPEREALAAAGIHPGADGWEIDEAPVLAVKVGDLFRSKSTGNLRRVAARDTGVHRERWRLDMATGDAESCWEFTDDLLDPSQWTRCENTVPRALPPGVAWYQHGVNEHRLEAGRRVLATARFFEHHAEWQIGERSYEASDGWIPEPTLDAAMGAAETACRERGIFAALPPPERPQPTGDAARILRRLLSLAAREDEHGPIAAPAGETPEERAATRGRLVDAFLAELSATKPKPADLSFDERSELITYLEGNERDWNGRDAVRYAVGLLRDRKTKIDDLEASLYAAREEVYAAREEAATSDANAVELAGKLDAAQERIAKLGGEIDALQTALEASRGAVKMAESLRDGAIRRAEKAEEELGAIRSRITTIIDGLRTAWAGGAS